MVQQAEEGHSLSSAAVRVAEENTIGWDNYSMTSASPMSRGGHGVPFKTVNSRSSGQGFPFCDSVG